MRFLPTIKDSRGNDSHTLFFVACALIILLVRFAVAGFKLGSLGPVPNMSAGEFGAAFALIMGIWTAREYKQKGIEANKQ